GNHLKQIGGGLQNYSDVFGSLPYGARSRASSEGTDEAPVIVNSYSPRWELAPGNGTISSTGPTSANQVASETLFSELRPAAPPALPPAPVTDPSPQTTDGLQLLVTPRIIIQEEDAVKLGRVEREAKDSERAALNQHLSEKQSANLQPKSSSA